MRLDAPPDYTLRVEPPIDLGQSVEEHAGADLDVWQAALAVVA
jgi:hypothetical protein